MITKENMVVIIRAMTGVIIGVTAMIGVMTGAMIGVAVMTGVTIGIEIIARQDNHKAGFIRPYDLLVIDQA